MLHRSLFIQLKAVSLVPSLGNDLGPDSSDKKKPQRSISSEFSRRRQIGREEGAGIALLSFLENLQAGSLYQAAAAAFTSHPKT